jgi:hypothetical protein
MIHSQYQVGSLFVVISIGLLNKSDDEQPLARLC